MMSSKKIKVSGILIGSFLMLMGTFTQPAYSDVTVCPDSTVVCNVTYADGTTVESEKGKDRGAIEYR